MPVLPRISHERFAQALAAGYPQIEAYEGAGYEPDAGNAARLAATPAVRARVHELLARSAATLEVSRDDVTRGLYQVIWQSEADASTPAGRLRMNAWVQLARLHGLLPGPAGGRPPRPVLPHPAADARGHATPAPGHCPEAPASGAAPADAQGNPTTPPRTAPGTPAFNTFNTALLRPLATPSPPAAPTSPQDAWPDLPPPPGQPGGLPPRPRHAVPFDLDPDAFDPFTAPPNDAYPPDHPFRDPLVHELTRLFAEEMVRAHSDNLLEVFPGLEGRLDPALLPGGGPAAPAPHAQPDTGRDFSPDFAPEVAGPEDTDNPRPPRNPTAPPPAPHPEPGTTLEDIAPNTTAPEDTAPENNAHVTTAPNDTSPNGGRTPPPSPDPTRPAPSPRSVHEARVPQAALPATAAFTDRQPPSHTDRPPSHQREPATPGRTPDPNASENPQNAGQTDEMTGHDRVSHHSPPDEAAHATAPPLGPTSPAHPAGPPPMSLEHFRAITDHAADILERVGHPSPNLRLLQDWARDPS